VALAAGDRSVGMRLGRQASQRNLAVTPSLRGSAGCYGARVSSTPSAVVFQTAPTWRGGAETAKVVLNDPTPTMKLLLCNSCTGALIFFTSVPCSERVVVKQWLSSGSVQFLM
jgi:hypothetical protein